MEQHKERTNSRLILVLAAVFLCLFMAGNASATTFPVDEAGISAYVKVSDSIDLETVMENLLPHIYQVLEVNPTYFIVTVTNDDNQNTHLYVGADGWVISYYRGTEEVSRAVRWNIASDEDPTPEGVTSMTTLEEVISKTCDAAGVDYETIKSGIKFYDFEHPNADRMMFVVDMQSGQGSNSFYIAIPPEVTVKESSYSHYYNVTFSTTQILLNGGVITYAGVGKGASYGYKDLSVSYRHTIELRNNDPGVHKSGVCWVVVYTLY
jgi:uncharacterized protein YpmB